MQGSRYSFTSGVAALLFALSLPPSAPADTSAPALAPVLAAPLQVSILAPPVVFRSNGRQHLAYEIQITNWSDDAWTARRIEVSSEKGALLLGVDGDEIAGLLRHPGRTPEAKDAAADTLAPRETMLAFMWIDLPPGAAIPTQLRHSLTVQRKGEPARQLDAPTTLVSGAVREIAAPLRGGNWLAANGPSNTSHHRRAALVLGGAPHISQRYAIDWVRLGADMKTSHGDPTDNRSYLCYGEQVLAVADGVVAEVKDGIVQNVPNQPPAVPITLETIAGNHINLDLGGGVFAMYAHLQPGSLRVKLGDRVKRGQVLALLGNTGNSSEPHLHFQLMNGNSPLQSEGLPYSLAQYTIALYVSGELGEHLWATPLAAPEVHRGEIPLEMQLVNFE
jgi:murein DD-endopeptidase